MPNVTLNPPKVRTETSGGAFNVVWNGVSWTTAPELVVVTEIAEIEPEESCDDLR